jgi:lipooligosaccharide transport system permease protein
MATLPSAGTLLPLHLAWILTATVIFCVISINLMRRRLIV